MRIKVAGSIAFTFCLLHEQAHFTQVSNYTKGYDFIVE